MYLTLTPKEGGLAIRTQTGQPNISNEKGVLFKDVSDFTIKKGTFFTPKSVERVCISKPITRMVSVHVWECGG